MDRCKAARKGSMEDALSCRKIAGECWHWRRTCGGRCMGLRGLLRGYEGVSLC